MVTIVGTIIFAAIGSLAAARQLIKRHGGPRAATSDNSVFGCHRGGLNRADVMFALQYAGNKKAPCPRSACRSSKPIYVPVEFRGNCESLDPPRSRASFPPSCDFFDAPVNRISNDGNTVLLHRCATNCRAGRASGPRGSGQYHRELPRETVRHRAREE